MNEPREVTKAEYYQTIGPLDVIGTIQGPYPYTTTHKTRWPEQIIGKCVDYFPEGLALTETRYYLYR